MERRRYEELIKKGPWTPEEDQVLINFVNKYGPRDWSSIRSMGLLPRTGKSCRLRWVNKLRPNLKIGCKFSAEEERVVIELQGRLGNKWATIASYLPGRTDNDVKNFWSTRQKRLARILQSPPRQTKPPKNRGKSLPVPEMTAFQVPKYGSMKLEEESSSNCQSWSSSCMGDQAGMVQMIIPLPRPADLITPNMPNDILGSNLPLLEITETDEVHTKPSTTESEAPLHLPFTQHIPNSSSPELDLPLAMPENHDSVLLAETHYLDVSELENVPDLNFGSPFLELEGTGNKGHGRAQESEKLATPDSFFDELPADMFDCFDPFPSSSSSL